jgi:hypothetical protein
MYMPLNAEYLLSIIYSNIVNRVRMARGHTGTGLLAECLGYKMVKLMVYVGQKKKFWYRGL